MIALHRFEKQDHAVLAVDHSVKVLASLGDNHFDLGLSEARPYKIRFEEEIDNSISKDVVDELYEVL